MEQSNPAKPSESVISQQHSAPMCPLRSNCSLIKQLCERSIKCRLCWDFAEMCIEYCIILRDEGWMIERQGQLYGPYPSQQQALREAEYVATYSINHGLPAQVIVQTYSQGARIV